MADNEDNKPTEPTQPSDIRPVSLTDEMKRSYLDYAMSVIVSRALPDVRDGLKPVHRRIMISMFLGALVVAGLFTLVPGRIMRAVVFGN